MSAFSMGTWLLDSFLVTSLLMAAILLIRRPVAKIFGAGVAYALWLIPAARLLMPSLTGEAVSVSESAHPVGDSILAGISSGEHAATVAAAPGIDFAAIAIALWLGGAAFFFIIQMIRYASMRDDLLSEAAELAVIDGVRIVASDQVGGPLAFGLFKRHIAVPQDFNKAYSPAERKLAIAHEMAHHKSGDLFANLAAFIVLCLQWFNPLAWLSWSAFRFDQEAACDARVLAGKDAADREIYGRTLARTAFDGVPTFATALNSPKTIIERLRRLTMKDASPRRRSLGKVGILTAAAIILPLTATVVPAISAHDEAVLEPNQLAILKKNEKAISVNDDGKTVHVTNYLGNSGKVTKVERHGKTFILRTDKNLSDNEIDRLIDKVENARVEADAATVAADAALVEADNALAETNAARVDTDHAVLIASHTRAVAEFGRAEAMRVMSNIDIASYIPEIDIRETTKNCREGQPVTTNVHGFDGQSKSHIKIVICGKGQGRIARTSAIEGLRDAQQELRSNSDVPDSIRRDIVSKLEKQIYRLEKELDRKLPEAPKPPRAPREPQAPNWDA